MLGAAREYDDDPPTRAVAIDELSEGGCFCRYRIGLSRQVPRATTHGDDDAPLPMLSGIIRLKKGTNHVVVGHGCDVAGVERGCRLLQVCRLDVGRRTTSKGKCELLFKGAHYPRDGQVTDRKGGEGYLMILCIKAPGAGDMNHKPSVNIDNARFLTSCCRRSVV